MGEWEIRVTDGDSSRCVREGGRAWEEDPVKSVQSFGSFVAIRRGFRGRSGRYPPSVLSFDLVRNCTVSYFVVDLPSLLLGACYVAFLSSGGSF